MDALITVADQRLYGAKRRGRDRIVADCSLPAA
jgi:PleD family two-component response regulator